MRISDCSSDVCSSDLGVVEGRRANGRGAARHRPPRARLLRHRHPDVSGVQPPPGPAAAPSRQGAEGWFPAAIALWAGTALVVWAGAVLADVLAGEPRAIAFGAAARAVFSLPGHLREPARAWP